LDLWGELPSVIEWFRALVCYNTFVLLIIHALVSPGCIFLSFLVCAEFRAPLNLKEPVQVGEWAAHEQIVTTFDLH
jgi:hypothetical protein